MILMELTRSRPLEGDRIGFLATEAYANLRGPVLNRETISNRDWKLLETPATQTKQSPRPCSNRDKMRGYSSTDIRPVEGAESLRTSVSWRLSTSQNYSERWLREREL